MDELKALEELARQARKEEPPVRGVTARVLAEIRSRRRFRVRPLSVFAAASAVAASVLLAVAVHYWTSAPDPLTELCASFEVTELW